jgi:hypothetical protein
VHHTQYVCMPVMFVCLRNLVWGLLFWVKNDEIQSNCFRLSRQRECRCLQLCEGKKILLSSEALDWIWNVTNPLLAGTNKKGTTKKIRQHRASADSLLLSNRDPENSGDTEQKHISF